MPSCLIMLPNLTLDLGDAVEAAMLPKTKVVIIDEPVVVLSEAEDSVLAVADSEVVDPVEAAEAVHQGARVPKEQAKEEPKKVIFYY